MTRLISFIFTLLSVQLDPRAVLLVSVKFSLVRKV